MAKFRVMAIEVSRAHQAMLRKTLALHSYDLIELEGELVEEELKGEIPTGAAPFGLVDLRPPLPEEVELKRTINLTPSQARNFEELMDKTNAIIRYLKAREV